MEHNKAFIQAIIDRMKTVLGVLRDREVAEYFEGSRSTLSAWKSRGTIPFAECLEMAEKHQISLDWLILGRGVPAVAPEGEVPVKAVHFCVVPTFDAHGDLVELPESEWWSLPIAWLSHQCLSCGETIIVRAVGDAMGESITDGQLVLIDRRRQDVDGVYLVRIGGAARFKRFQRMVDGSLQISSDNPAYAAERIAPGDEGQIEIIGYCHSVVKALR